MRSLALLVALALCAVSPAGAQGVPAPFSGLTGLPNPAIAGQAVRARVLHDGCVGAPFDQTVVVSGTTVTWTMRINPLVCFIPIPGAFEIPLGTLPAGSYTLVFAPRSLAGEPYVPLSVPFQVASAQAVPAISAPFAVVLAALLFALGLLAPNCVFKPTAQHPLSQSASPRVRGGLTRR